MTDSGTPEPIATWEAVVEAGKVREFSRAVKDGQPESEDMIPAPTFPAVLNADFVEWLIAEYYPLDRHRTVHGEQILTYERPLRAGERLKCAGYILSDETREGKRGGRMRRIETEVRFENAETGEPIGTEGSVILELEHN